MWSFFTPKKEGRKGGSKARREKLRKGKKEDWKERGREGEKKQV